LGAPVRSLKKKDWIPAPRLRISRASFAGTPAYDMQGQAERGKGEGDLVCVFLLYFRIGFFPAFADVVFLLKYWGELLKNVKIVKIALRFVSFVALISSRFI